MKRILFSFFLFAASFLIGEACPEDILWPEKLEKGDLIGIFTPSWPAHIILRDKYLHALEELKKAGFEYIEGSLTASLASEGYRTASPEERANEFMELIRNPQVKCLMATIGGYNSSSLIPFLDYEEIRKSRKLICGYSDLTALHLAILKYSGLSTFYGPSLVPSFGEFPSIPSYTLESFLQMAMGEPETFIELKPPPCWSHQFIDAQDPNWKTIKRDYEENSGWKVLVPGYTEGRLVVANVEVLIFSAGTPYFPFLEGKILLLEETSANFSRTERTFRQLEQIGVFDQIKGLILSKPGSIQQEGAPFNYLDLLTEIIGKRTYPIIYDFDCGHTFPSITLAEHGLVFLNALEEFNTVEISVKVGL